MDISLTNSERIRLLKHVNTDIRKSEQSESTTIDKLTKLQALREKLVMPKAKEKP